MSPALQLGPIGQVSLLVTETARAERFYRDTLGLPHLYTFGDLAFFEAGGVRLYLQAVPASDWMAGSVLYFRVSDIGAAHRELVARGVEFAQPPGLVHRHASTGIEEWMAFFRDSEGNMLALMAQVPGEHAAQT